MSLREDIEAMERHKQNGTLREYLRGTADPLPPEPWPADKSATAHPDTTYGFIKSRED